jgi:arabinofuranosyltransferase
MKTPKSTWWWFLGAVITVLTIVAWTNRFVQDDAFITFRYADNLVRGNGLVFNVGERVEGYTNFLWTLMMSVPIALKLDPVPTSYAIGLVCFIVSLLLTYQLCLLMFRSKAAAILAVVLLGTNYTFSAYATGGLETQLQTALLTGCVFLCFRILKATSPSARSLLGLSLLYSAAILTRMDSLIFVFVLSLVLLKHIWWGDFDNKERMLSTSLLLLPMFLVIGSWLVWKQAYYGDILPNSYHVKVGGGSSIIRGVMYEYHFIRSYWLFAFIFLGLAFTHKFIEHRSRELFTVMTIIALWAMYTVKVGGDFMEFRFWVPILPLVFILISWMVWCLIHQKEVRVGLVALAIGGAIFHMVRYETVQEIGSIDELKRYIESPRDNWPGIGRTLGQLFDEQDGNVAIAVTPAGAIPYYSRLKTVDMLGINDKYVARNGVDVSEIPGHRRVAPIEYLVASGVNIVVGHPRMHTRDESGPTYNVALARELLWYQFAESALPEGARFVEIPIGEHYILPVLYLVESPLVNDVIQARNLATHPVLRRSEDT